ncbi:MAG TPA: YraN family protein [Candidatus Polarisedimenticolia bacterium]|nr:YraN family protein [Candidatus Polarisedimenticolia bacterium]
MSRSRQSLGLAGEALAERHLTSRGFRVVARRYRTRLGEIDLVVRRGTLLVFVEVRARRGARYGTAAESVHPLKQARLVRAAAGFLAANPQPEGDPLCRFDVVAITWPEGADPILDHIEDAFRPVL